MGSFRGRAVFPDLRSISRYRGQNANMHACEFDFRLPCDQAIYYLNRAAEFARRFAGELADLGGGMIWEHYTSDWRIDWFQQRQTQ